MIFIFDFFGLGGMEMDKARKTGALTTIRIVAMGNQVYYG